jgi:hypothetical protein
MAAAAAVAHGARLVASTVMAAVLVVTVEAELAVAQQLEFQEPQTPVVAAAAELLAAPQVVQVVRVLRSFDMRMFLPLQRSPRTSRKAVHSRIRSR